VSFEFPTEIEPSTSGKYRFTVCKVARNRDQHTDLFQTEPPGAEPPSRDGVPRPDPGQSRLG